MFLAVEGFLDLLMAQSSPQECHWSPVLEFWRQQTKYYLWRTGVIFWLLFPEGSIPAVAGATDLSCSKDLAFRPSFLTFGPGNWCKFSNCQGHVHLESLPETMFADTKDCSSFSPVQVWSKKPAAHWLPVPWCTVPYALCLGLGSFVESTLFFYSLDLKVLAKSQTKSFYQISS